MSCRWPYRLFCINRCSSSLLTILTAACGSLSYGRLRTGLRRNGDRLPDAWDYNWTIRELSVKHALKFRLCQKAAWLQLMFTNDCNFIQSMFTKALSRGQFQHTLSKWLLLSRTVLSLIVLIIIGRRILIHVGMFPILFLVMHRHFGPILRIDGCTLQASSFIHCIEYLSMLTR